MDAELAQLVTTAAGTLVASMADDGWQVAKQAVLARWRREQPQEVARLDSYLDRTRAVLLAAEEQDRSTVLTEQISEWQVRLREMLADPAAERALRGVFQDAESAVSFGAPTHFGSGDVHQAGRDITVTRHGNGGPGPKN
ncbi:hypothetical protein AB0869_10740 [Micromonospora vinacea]|uniref:hypothetical protein n=1 Tax=Micromonospora vinacea TaxID=709878 RepID=UPI00345211ED